MMREILAIRPPRRAAPLKHGGVGITGAVSYTHLDVYKRQPYPHRPEKWEPEYLYEPLPEPVDHPEFDLFGVRRMVEVEEALTNPATRQPAEKNQEPMRARMLNEFVYCPRLFYYEQVEGVFVENADTARGSAIHEKVDRGKGALLRAKKKASAAGDEPGVESLPTAAPSTGEPSSETAAAETLTPAEDAEPPMETIHSRSAMMSSTRLDVVAKICLLYTSRCV